MEASNGFTTTTGTTQTARRRERTCKSEREEWAEGGLEREHMAPLVLRGRRERGPAGVGEERGGR